MARIYKMVELMDCQGEDVQYNNLGIATSQNPQDINVMAKYYNLSYQCAMESQHLFERSLWSGMALLRDADSYLQVAGQRSYAGYFRLPSNFSRGSAYLPRSDTNLASTKLFPCYYIGEVATSTWVSMRCLNILIMKTRSWTVHVSWTEIYV